MCVCVYGNGYPFTRSLPSTISKVLPLYEPNPSWEICVHRGNILPCMIQLLEERTWKPCLGKGICSLRSKVSHSKSLPTAWEVHLFGKLTAMQNSTPKRKEFGPIGANSFPLETLTPTGEIRRKPQIISLNKTWSCIHSLHRYSDGLVYFRLFTKKMFDGYLLSRYSKYFDHTYTVIYQTNQFGHKTCKTCKAHQTWKSPNDSCERPHCHLLGRRSKIFYVSLL